MDRLESLTEDQGRAATTADESAVLRELGHPQQVAASFLPPQTLVNTTWFPIFKQCLIYGLFAVFVVQLIGFCVATLSGSDIRITAIVSRLINHRLPAPISEHINSILHWVLIVSACLFLFWTLRSGYRIYFLRKI